MIDIDDNHLCSPSRRSAGLDRSRIPVKTLQEAHKPRGLSAGEQMLPFSAQRREVRTDAGPALKQLRFADIMVRDRTLPQQLVRDGQDKAGHAECAYNGPPISTTFPLFSS